MGIGVKLREWVALVGDMVVKLGGFTLGCGRVSTVPVGALHRVSEKKFTAIMSEFLCPFLHKLAHSTLFVGIADILCESVDTRTVAFSVGTVEVDLTFFLGFTVQPLIARRSRIGVQFVRLILLNGIKIALHGIAKIFHVIIFR